MCAPTKEARMYEKIKKHSNHEKNNNEPISPLETASENLPKNAKLVKIQDCL